MKLEQNKCVNLSIITKGLTYDLHRKLFCLCFMKRSHSFTDNLKTQPNAHTTFAPKLEDIKGFVNS